MLPFCVLQVKIHRSTIPEDKSNVIISHLNEAFDKSTIEKVGFPPFPSPRSPAVISTGHIDLSLPSYFGCVLGMQDVATYVKKKCDEQLSGTWHCVVGRNFGCSITHDTKYVLFLQIDQLHALVFKSLE